MSEKQTERRTLNAAQRFKLITTFARMVDEFASDSLTNREVATRLEREVGFPVSEHQVKDLIASSGVRWKRSRAAPSETPRKPSYTVTVLSRAVLEIAKELGVKLRDSELLERMSER